MTIQESPKATRNPLIRPVGVALALSATVGAATYFNNRGPDTFIHRDLAIVTLNNGANVYADSEGTVLLGTIDTKQYPAPKGCEPGTNRFDADEDSALMPAPKPDEQLEIDVNTQKVYELQDPQTIDYRVNGRMFGIYTMSLLSCVRDPALWKNINNNTPDGTVWLRYDNDAPNGVMQYGFPQG